MVGIVLLITLLILLFSLSRKEFTPEENISIENTSNKDKSKTVVFRDDKLLSECNSQVVKLKKSIAMIKS